mmetsp:Transcript_52817/g.164154  ORF Transcript_52817/g.164154 Transcript_52817/m.164154 type:complete len:262 (-) Transcript_52817:1531-2316(-)
MPFWRCAVSPVTAMVMSNNGTVDHRIQGPTSSMKQSTETVVAQVPIARYVGRALMASIARPKSDSALEQRILTLAVFCFASATENFPTRSCQTVASPMPPVRSGTRRSAEASPSAKGATAPAVVATAAGNKASSRGTPRAAARATVAPARPRLVTMVSNTSCWSPSSSVLPPPKFVTLTLRLTPSDCETIPNSAATKWTLRRLSLFSILKSRCAPTGSCNKLSLMRSENVSFWKSSLYRRCNSRVVEESASCFRGLRRPVV